jgi:hypothetical protein
MDELVLKIMNSGVVEQGDVRDNVNFDWSEDCPS